MINAINWFLIPAKDFPRACKFYSEVLGKDVNLTEFDGEKVGILPNFDMQANGVGGHIALNPEGVSDKGVMIYLNGGKDLQIILDKVEPAGGKLVQPKTPSPGGFMAIFLDSEGNKIAIHNP